MLSTPFTSVVEIGAGLVGAHGPETGVIVTALLLVWRGHRILAAVQKVLRTIRIGFVSAALVGLIVLLAISMGWISLSSLPSLPSLPLPF